MDLVKIGKLLQDLRKEKGLTQEALAEKMGVARRTVSRWETGANMPDLDVLIELSDLYAVDLREILNGERKSQIMNTEQKETLLQAAQYSNEKNRRSTIVVSVFFVIGILALLGNVAMDMLDAADTFWVGFLKGVSMGFAIGAMILGLLYVTGKLAKMMEAKRRLLGLDRQE